MVCTRIVVASPQPTVTLSSKGFGTATMRFSDCNLAASMAGAPLYAWADYVTVGSPDRIDFHITYIDEKNVSKVVDEYIIDFYPSGSVKIPLGDTIEVGIIDSLTMDATAS